MRSCVNLDYYLTAYFSCFNRSFYQENGGQTQGQSHSGTGMSMCSLFGLFFHSFVNLFIFCSPDSVISGHQEN